MRDCSKAPCSYSSSYSTPSSVTVGRLDKFDVLLDGILCPCWYVRIIEV